MNQREIERTLGSHQPLLKAVLQVLRPRKAIELGCGPFSTAHLVGVPNLLTITHDRKMANQVQSAYPQFPTHNWVIEKFQGVTAETKRGALSDDVEERIGFFYSMIGSSTSMVDLLFVDTFPCCTIPAVLALAKKAKCVILHNVEPSAYERYGWRALDIVMSCRKKYIHRPPKQQTHWTGVFSTGRLPLREINAIVRNESIDLWDEPSQLIEIGEW